MKNKKIFLKILGILFIIGPFLYNKYNVIRLLCVILGMILILLEKRNVLKKIGITLLLVILIFSGDVLLAKYFKHIPIFSYEVVSSKEVITYNSFFYRVYNCQNNLIFDPFYKENYICDTILPEQNVNSVLSNIINNFSKYKNKDDNLEIYGENHKKEVL